MLGTFVNKHSVYLILINLILKCSGLEKISSKTDNTIITTETMIRKTANKLFTTLNMRGVRSNEKLRQFALAHSFMVRVTMRDHKTHNTIIKLTRVDDHPSNVTKALVNLVYDILNEELKDLATSNANVRQYVDSFLTKLEEFKQKSGRKDTEENLNINKDVLRKLEEVNTKSNITEFSNIEADEILSGADFWVPEIQTRRIYQGQRTKIKYFPFMASIELFNSFQCAGSIIKSDLILTAASCLQLAWNNRFYRENPAFLSVRVGSTFYNGGGEQIPVLEVYFHPDYNPKNLRNNICVLRLLRRLKFSKKRRYKVKKIEIDRIASPLPMTDDGITILGWGAMGTSNVLKNPFINRLAFAVLDVYHLRECQEIYSREYVSRSNFCAGFISKGGGACNHDVGGPGIVGGILTGVISFGSPVCGTPDAPTVFTKVGYYADWIDDIMEMEVPVVKRKSTTRSTTHLPLAAPTTYKMKPMTTWETTTQSALRISKDEDLFKEFLKTMFASEEAQDYTNLLNGLAVVKARDYEKMSGQSEEDFKKGKKKEASIKKLSPHSETFTNSQTMHNLGSLNIETNKKPEKIQDLTVVHSNHPINKEKRLEIKHIKENYKKENDVMSLSYISNEDIPQKPESQDIDENNNDGLAIPVDGFKDFTYRNYNPMLDSLPRSELYDLLNKALQEDNDFKV